MLVSGCFSLLTFGSESGCPVLENQDFGYGGIAKNNFHRSCISYDSSEFVMILSVRGHNFHDFGCPGDWLEI